MANTLELIRDRMQFRLDYLKAFNDDPRTSNSPEMPLESIKTIERFIDYSGRSVR